MNKTIRRASVFSLLLILALLVRVTWVQAYKAEALADDKHNRRTTIARYDTEAWKQLTGDADKPLVNRALRQPLPPGSTFKLVVAAAALEEGLYASVDSRTDSPDPYSPPGTSRVLENENKSAPCENATLRTALQYSCNNVFGKLAVDLGEDKVRAMAERFGFNDDKLDVPVRASKSIYPSGMDKPSTAYSGIGQFEVTATPLQIAMVSAAIANGGASWWPRPWSPRSPTPTAAHCRASRIRSPNRSSARRRPSS